ncbi:copper resistance D family protein [Pseudoduganella sp. UC29_106]|uniref:copper resistance D family protein n=1 Tax=Pseudoduganella sp. UC29_106 TaxID=3374553 RepID=UPI003757D158
MNLGFTWLVGTWLARRWMIASGVARAEFEPELQRLDLLAAGLGIVAGIAVLWAATAVMGGLPLSAALPMVWPMLSTTDYGHAGCIAVLMMVLIFVLLLSKQARPASDAMTLVGLVIFAVTRASMGHAGEEGLWTVPLAAEAAHYWSIAAWTGAVLASGWFALRERRIAALPGHAITPYLDQMSTMAMAALVVLLGTGFYSGLHRVGTVTHLVHSAYGAVLLIKIGLVLLAIALGGYNKYIGLPAASRSDQGKRTVRLVLQIESVLLLGALLAASYLTTQPPPMAI